VVGCSGGVLLSHDLAVAVPSALEGLASGFGMGPGVSPPLWPPEHRTTPTTNSCGVVWGCSVWTRARFSLEACLVSLGAVWAVVVCWASPRPISTSPLNTLRCVHVWPINPLVWWGP
jgi:hypothetical protein